jgi:hypothetical protein
MPFQGSKNNTSRAIKQCTNNQNKLDNSFIIITFASIGFYPDLLDYERTE